MILRGKNREILATVALLHRSSPVMSRRVYYAPRGPVFQSLEDYRTLVEFLIRYTADQGGCLLRMDPPINAGDRAFQQLAGELGFTIDPRADFTTCQPRNVYQLALSGDSEAALLSRFHPKTRYNIRLAQRRGVTVRQGGTAELPVFMKMMAQTARRNGFQPRDEGFFRRILDAGRGEVVLLLAQRGGEILAGAVEIIQGNRAWYAYGCSQNAGRRDMPNVLLQWEMIRRALSSGCTIYDMRGVEGWPDTPGRSRGLHRFKQGFDGQLVEYVGQMELVLRPFIWRMVRAWIYLRQILAGLRPERGKL